MSDWYFKMPSSYDTTFPRPMNRVIGRTIRCSTAIYRRHHHCHWCLITSSSSPWPSSLQGLGIVNLFCGDQPFVLVSMLIRVFHTHFPRSPSSFICFPVHSTLLFLTSRSINPPLAICDCAVSRRLNAHRSLKAPIELFKSPVSGDILAIYLQKMLSLREKWPCQKCYLQIPIL